MCVCVCVVCVCVVIIVLKVQDVYTRMFNTLWK